MKIAIIKVRQVTIDEIAEVKSTGAHVSLHRDSNSSEFSGEIGILADTNVDRLFDCLKTIVKK